MPLSLDEAPTGISGVLVKPFDGASETAPERLVPIVVAGRAPVLANGIHSNRR